MNTIQSISKAVDIFEELYRYKDYFKKVSDRLFKRSDSYAKQLRDCATTSDKNEFIQNAESIFSSFCSDENIVEDNTSNYDKNIIVQMQSDQIVNVSVLNLLNKNLKKVSYILLLLSFVFSLIAVALINSSIRLTIYSKRFLIKTMQLVGATKSFIRKPFLWKSIQHGLIASLLSILFLHFLISYSVNFLPEIQRLHTTNAKLSIYSTILLLGFFIPWACTYFAIRKYLKITTDELYY